MNRNAYALKRALVALGHGSAENYKGHNVVQLLKELAVVEGAAPSVGSINTSRLDGVLNFIANNKGVEENEPYDLSITATGATVVVKRGNKTLSEGTDILYNGDKLKITATAAEGKELTALTVNGEDFTSGEKFEVNGHNVAIVATAETQTFDLARTETECTISVTRGDEVVSDGTDVLSYGDEIVIAATAAEGKQMTSLQVNGEDFTSGETLTVSANVEIEGVAEPV